MTIEDDRAGVINSLAASAVYGRANPNLAISNSTATAGPLWPAYIPEVDKHYRLTVLVERLDNGFVVKSPTQQRFAKDLTEVTMIMTSIVAEAEMQRT